MFRLVVIVSLVVSVNSALAITGATVPWITYEAETMTISGGTILGPPEIVSDKNQTVTNTVTREASGLQCVRLSGTGQYVQFPAQSAANTMVVRYSVPDTAGGGGADYTISLYVNGSFVRKIPVTSKYSWLYGYPVSWANTPSDMPRNFYDEARASGLSINSNDVVRLQKDADDTASYYVIDFVDLEQIAPALTQPPGSTSVMNYGATGNGVTDDTNPIRSAVAAGGTVWVPPGNYLVTGSIAVPGNTTIQGAGMWYTTFVGSPSTYVNENGRVRFNGAGHNIHFRDFAILGKLTTREDWMANDGFSEYFGTGSSMERVWVEHTKTGAWIANSIGMLITDCRFRNTIADGINLSKGANSCIVSNCTARNNGDDCFAIWPAIYTGGGSLNYWPGFNVIKNCTADQPWFANGCGIYGAVSNRVENSLFRDIPNGAGILIAGTFPVGTNVFGGVTIARNCDVVRGGGNDPGWRWRGALTICPDGLNINGLEISNVNLSNSLSYAVQFLSPGSGTLTNATMTNVKADGYAVGVREYHPQDPWPNHTNYCDGVFGVLARNDAKGSITVAGLSVNNTNILALPTSGTLLTNQSNGQFTFNFLIQPINVTVQANPLACSFTVDGTNYTGSQVFSWLPGQQHTIAAISPQSGGAGTQFVWSAWSDGGAASHTVAPMSGTTYTANFSPQYYLTMNAGMGGTVYPASGWNNPGANIYISANASNGFIFAGWNGSGSGSYSGSSSLSSITMNGPITETASFADGNISVTVQANPSDRIFMVDGSPYNTTQVFSWPPGSTHTISTTSPQTVGPDTQYLWSSWSDGGAISHTVTPTTTTNYTVNFTTQYYLTMNAGAGGTVSPSSGWYDSGTTTNISAIPSGGYTFTSWTGSGSGSYSGANNPASITMNGPITETASFALIPTRLISLSGDLTFGNLSVGSSSNRTFTINNAGNSTLTVSNIAYPDGFSGAWSGAIPSGGSTNVTVTFSPLAITNYPGNLTVNSDATGGVNTLPVSGTGVSTNGAPQAPIILSITVNPDSTVRLIYTTMSGYGYHVEATPDLTPASWTTLPGSSCSGTGDPVTFTDTTAPGNQQRYYRVGSP